MTNIEKLRAVMVETCGKSFTDARGFNISPELADVLRAMDEKTPDWVLTCDGTFYKENDPTKDEQYLWNLTKNLDDQSPETIDFLTSVLCK